MRSQIAPRRSAAQLGILLLKWFLHDKVAFPEARDLLSSFTAPPGRSGRNRDVLPLPCQSVSRSVAAAVSSMDRAPCPNQESHSARTKQRHLVTLGRQAWTVCQTMSLNMAWGKELVVFAEPSVSQSQALEHFAEKSLRFVQTTNEAGLAVRCQVSDWNHKLESVSVGYTGEVVEKAQWLTLEQMLPGLPPEGKSACIELSDLCSGDVRKCLEDPSLVLKQQDFSDSLPKARVLCTDSEWAKIAKELVRKGLARPLKREEVHHINGRPLVNGAFGVSKSGKFCQDGRPVLRFIMDLRPSNHIQAPIVGDISTLSGPGKWVNLVLPKGQVLRISGDDLTAAFYLFRLPSSWHSLFAFEKTLRHCDLFEDSEDQSDVYLAATVMPMGWLSAVGILQHAHRRLATLVDGEGLPLLAEIRRDAPLPKISTDAFQELWHLYLDDSTFLEWVDEESTQREDTHDTQSPFQRVLQRIYGSWGIPWSESKSVRRQQLATRLGVELDGDRGLLGVHLEKRLEVFELAFFLLSQEQLTRKSVQIFLGKVVHIMQFRRPAFSFVQFLWRRVIGPPVAGPLSALERREVFAVLGALPLLETNLRAKLSHKVTASDASETGGGVCEGERMTAVGHYVVALETLQATSVPHCLSSSKGVLLFDWFGNIGGVRQALDLLHVPVVKGVLCESDSHSAAVYRKRWGIDVLWKKLEDITMEHIRQILRELPQTSVVLQVASWNETDHSSLSGLVRAQAWVQSCCREVGVQHFGLLEVPATASVDTALFVGEWSHHFCCSSGCSRVREQKSYWTSSSLAVDTGVSLQKSLSSNILHISAPSEPNISWLPAPWVWPGGHADPTLRFPSFGRHHSEDIREDLLLSSGSSRRPLCAAEREILLGFPKSHTRSVLKQFPGTAGENIRLALVARASHAVVLANILRMGLKQLGWESPLPLAADIAKERALSLIQWPCEKPPSGPGAEIQYDTLAETEVKVRHALAEKEVVLEVQDHRSLETLHSQASLPHLFLRRAEYRGSDVRLDTGMLLRPERAPRITINPHLWVWSSKLAWRWQHPAHINLLEMRACLRSFMWRSRSKRFYKARIMHLLDSQVCLAVLVKGRSSSVQLNALLRRFAALVLACDVLPLFAYIKSEFNPADRPSRHASASMHGHGGRQVQTQASS